MLNQVQHDVVITNRELLPRLARCVSNILPTQITSVPRVHYFDTGGPAITANPLPTPLMVAREIVKKLNPPVSGRSVGDAR